MTRLFQAACIAAVAVAVAACSDSNPTAPAPGPAYSAAGDVSPSAAPLPTTSCTVVQVDATHFEATAAWKHLAVTSLAFYDGTALLAVSEFSHPKRSGTLTVTVSSAPTVVQITGTTLALRTTCSMTA